MSTQHNEVRFRQGTKDAELWLKWQGAWNIREADNMLLEYQKRDNPPDHEPEKRSTIQGISGVLYVDHSVIGNVSYNGIIIRGVEFRELPTTNRS